MPWRISIGLNQLASRRTSTSLASRPALSPSLSPMHEGDGLWPINRTARGDCHAEPAISLERPHFTTVNPVARFRGRTGVAAAVDRKCIVLPPDGRMSLRTVTAPVLAQTGNGPAQYADYGICT